MTERYEVTEPCRLLELVKTRLQEGVHSSRAIKRAIEKGVCKINGRRERFASKVLKEGDIVIIDEGWQEFLHEKRSAIDLLYEDDYLYVINKPCGLVSEDKAVQEALERSDLTLVHRLDKGTSGALLAAKSRHVKDLFITQFEKKAVEKLYLAVVDGVVHKKKGFIESYLRKKCENYWHSAPRGLFARTEWQKISSSKDHSLLLCRLVTGRTHQLRVHLKEMGRPILGDYHYAKEFCHKAFVPRLMLHAWRLAFVHPILNIPIKIEASLPPEFLPYAQDFNSQDIGAW